MRPLGWLRLTVTAGAIGLAGIHLVWPNLAIDPITLGLLVVAIVPWLAPLLKSLELPGGWRVEFQDLQVAASRADSAGLLAEPAKSAEEAFAFEAVAGSDPNLALAGLRIEIERRLNRLASAARVELRRPAGVGRLLRELTAHDVLTADERSILADMVGLLNNAVHGATVDPRGVAWAMTTGPRLLASLDERIGESGGN